MRSPALAFDIASNLYNLVKAFRYEFLVLSNQAGGQSKAVYEHAKNNALKEIGEPGSLRGLGLLIDHVR